LEPLGSGPTEGGRGRTDEIDEDDRSEDAGKGFAVE
jgi:hypothetical protein